MRNTVRVHQHRVSQNSYQKKYKLFCYYLDQHAQSVAFLLYYIDNTELKQLWR